MTPKQLKQARLDAGLTQKQMAGALLISLSNYKKWEGLEEFGPQMESNVDLRVDRWLRGKDNG